MSESHTDYWVLLEYEWKQKEEVSIYLSKVQMYPLTMVYGKW